MSWKETAEFLELVRSFCKVVPLTIEVHDHARALAERHPLSFYDACIASAALLAGCQALYTEDMHHGLVLEERLTLCNPFV